jgi:methionine synthase II (cobalamin-independent)
MALRAEHVGSLLRPPELLEARAAHEAGLATASELEAAEDAAILRALELQREVGLEVFSDGEYRRSWFACNLPDSVSGLVPNPERAEFVWEGAGSELAVAETVQVGLGLTIAGAPIRQVRRLAAHESTFLRDHAPGPYKVALTGAVQHARSWFRPGGSHGYPTIVDMVEDLVEIMRGEIRALADDGVSYFQLDSLLYVLDLPRPEGNRLSPEFDGDFLDLMIEADNTCLEEARAAGMTAGLHMCRGNNRSSWHAVGIPYEAMAERAFGSLEADRLLLEYDTDRAGGFEPLRFVREGTTVVLGLISSKVPELESRNTLLRRIDEASRYVPIERLALSPQCGFASTAPGNLVTWDDQRRKLELTVSVAHDVWGT